MKIIKQIPKGFLLYKQFAQIRNLSDLEWFALTPNYGESYGSYVLRYTVTKKLKLLNLGIVSARIKLRNFIISTSTSVADK